MAQYEYVEQDNKPSDSPCGCYFHQPNDCYTVTEHFVIAVCLSTQHTLRIAIYVVQEETLDCIETENYSRTQVKGCRSMRHLVYNVRYFVVTIPHC
jgi:hypothetical protein